MRLQVAAEEIMARKGKLAEDAEFNDIWIKRVVNLEETEKERLLTNEAKEKKDRDQEDESLQEDSRNETEEVVSSEKKRR
ncbi:hypothetical protein E2C01_019454 [Portunus trituberculatus]|uniref:Uncharacterized protein n=1 Tax=Portunus trituberculatus TaxID=210409 RepID=A0A5B7DXN9_PORTR|nr:hypothetical protein [Portunus trituberculatus]